MTALLGTGKVERDRLKLAGWGDECQSLSVSVRPAPVGNDGQPVQEWGANIGFNPGDWELRSGDEWWAQFLIPQADFDYMVASYRAKELRRLTLNVKAQKGLWIADLDQHTPIAYDVTWYLVPDKDRASSFPDLAMGTIEGVYWNDAALPWPPEPRNLFLNVDEKEEPTAEAPVETPRADPKPELVKAVTSLRNTVWKVGLFIAGALVVLWFK